MKQPEYLYESIKKVSSSKKLKHILESRIKITESYKNIEDNIDPIKTENDFISYLLSRFPSTYPVSHQIISMLKEFDIKSLIDIGAGPATCTYASLEIFKNLSNITLVERNPFFLDFSKTVLRENFKSLNFNFVREDLTRFKYDDFYDVGIMSYVINELDDNKKEETLKKIWSKINDFLIIIEPGTKKGFENIRKTRELLIKEKGYIYAPCTHNLACPIKDDDWCHFYKRVERTKEQMYLKSATESYEDEKFAYLIVSKKELTQLANFKSNEDEDENSNNKKSRIIRFPRILKGHVSFEICNESGINKLTVSAKNKNYKSSKKLSWGDLIEND
ncbi:MAG: small ribosomal subunit Rsm22 family protein [Cyanobacteriota bacterium]